MDVIASISRATKFMLENGSPENSVTIPSELHDVALATLALATQGGKDPLGAIHRALVAVYLAGHRDALAIPDAFLEE